jgi:MYXO-CTERM domain-containing protein
MKKTNMIAIAVLTAGSLAVSASADVLAYWAQNDNELPGGGFGFMEGDFPQAADVGSGFLTVGGGDILATNDDDVYIWIQSFAGTTLNALDGFPAGGSIAFQGGTDTVNNGAWMQWEVSTAGYENLVFSFAARGTATGFGNNQVSYSTDGESFTDFDDPFDPRDGANWNTFAFDFGNLLDDLETVYIRVTFDGATGATGNNRLDNILFEATAVPAPGALALLGLAGLIGVRRRRS